MVFFYKCEDERFIVYMGRDKHENEKLLAHGFPEDLWFHVDDYSSAHVYLRLPMDLWRQLMAKAYPPNGIPNKSQAGIKALKEADYREVIPESVIKEMCVLVKGNSIEGSKANNVDIVWCPFGNLKKDEQTMDVGSVTFHRKEQTWYVKRIEREAAILKVIEKTKEEKNVDLAEEKCKREREEIEYRKKLIAKMKADEKEALKAQLAHKELHSYDRLNDVEQMQTNDYGDNYGGTIEEERAIEDDFM